MSDPQQNPLDVLHQKIRDLNAVPGEGGTRIDAPERQAQVDDVTSDVVEMMSNELRQRMIEIQSEFNSLVDDSDVLKRLYTRVGLNDALCLALQTRDQEASMEIIEHPLFQLDPNRSIDEQNILAFAMRHDKDAFFHLLKTQPAHSLKSLIEDTSIVKYCVLNKKQHWVKEIISLSKEKQAYILNDLENWINLVDLRQPPYNQFMNVATKNNVKIHMSGGRLHTLINENQSEHAETFDFYIRLYKNINDAMNIDHAPGAFHVKLQNIKFRDKNTVKFPPLVSCVLYGKWEYASKILDRDDLDLERANARPKGMDRDISISELMQLIVKKNKLPQEAHDFIQKLEEKIGRSGWISPDNKTRRTKKPQQSWLGTNTP